MHTNMPGDVACMLVCRRVPYDAHVALDVQSLINGSDETHLCKSLRLNGIRWIEDGSPRSRHIVHEEVTPENVFRLILI